MKTAYYRTSTREQNSGMQVKAVLDYCLKNKIALNKQYSDIGESGSKDSRPQFDLMLSDLRAGKIDTIIVYKLDRIGRSLAHLVKLFEEFNKRNITFISISQNINTTTPEGRMFLHMLMVLAEYERELTVNRIKAGLNRARANGSPIGKRGKDKRPRRKSGYLLRWSKKTTPPNYGQTYT